MEGGNRPVSQNTQHVAENTAQREDIGCSPISLTNSSEFGRDLRRSVHIRYTRRIFGRCSPPSFRGGGQAEVGKVDVVALLDDVRRFYVLVSDALCMHVR
jgi:hypothetical protein